MNVAIVKYNAGNVRSVANALGRLGVTPILTDDADILQTADKVIFPGVGEASTAMKYLRERNLHTVITDLRRPVLAICLGMQLLGASSEENDAKCLGILPFRVRRFSGDAIKVPHMGWNNISYLSSALFDGVQENARAYFVHSYFVKVGEYSAARAHHGSSICAALSYQNFYGVQFHPEKSGSVGAKVLENFLNI